MKYSLQDLFPEFAHLISFEGNEAHNRIVINNPTNDQTHRFLNEGSAHAYLLKLRLGNNFERKASAKPLTHIKDGYHAIHS